ncbi:MAG: cation-translocating P-type ATPase [Phycisphaerales bacterium]|jgi:Cd2+/Zn2+-exporting ATPase|nr:cation-translocating P-type ATPase [Phycisphaerales bacterium]
MAHNHDGHDHNHHHDHAGHDHAGHSHAGMSPSEQAQHELQCCSHHEIEIERYMRLYLLGGVLVLVTTICNLFGLGDNQVAQLPAMVGAVMLGLPLFIAAGREVLSARLSSSSLAALAIIAALVTGEYAVAGWLAFILVVFGQLVRRSASGAQRAIAELVELTPDVARLVADGAEREVPLGQVRVGQVVRVRPGENLPVDGKVITGRSTINQASLTGEAAPVEVELGGMVYAGTVNLTGVIDLQVTSVGADTTIGKVTQLIRQAEQSRTPRQLLIEQVSAFFVPVVLAVAAVVWFFMSRSADEAVRASAGITAVTVLVVACPSALLLASPSAMLASFAAAARLGILIKQPSTLEAAANVNAIVFDKTGTITTGKFQVTKLAPATGVDGAELLRAAANGEQHSNHPLAQSILVTARSAKIDPDGSNDFEEFGGRGVRARTSVGEVCVGRASWLAELNPAARPEIEGVESRIEGMTGVHVMRSGQYLGAVGLEDTIRGNTRAVIQRLRELGARYIAIFTGDRMSVATRVGHAVGVDAIEAECLPEEKHEQIKGMVQSGYRTLMVGDGINDGPSLAAADVGVAMGLEGSDIATNSAGVALMNDDLSRVPFLIELARRSRSIITQNIAASIVIALVGLALAATGLISETGKFALPLAGLYHFAGDIFVLANSFRLFRFGESFVASEQGERPTLRRRAASVRGLASVQPV